MRKVLLVDNIWPQEHRMASIGEASVTILSTLTGDGIEDKYDAITVVGTCSKELEVRLRSICKEVAICRRQQLK